MAQISRFSGHVSQILHRIGNHATIRSNQANIFANYAAINKRGMAYDSSNEVHKKIHNLIANSPKKTFVFMKGVPKEPLCRYSGMVVQILDAYGVDYDSYDVLEDEEVRKGIKSYSDWPTIPQVFNKGSLMGGCDILLQMHQSGELKDLWGEIGPKSGDQAH